MTSPDELKVRLEPLVGVEGAPVAAPDPVNAPMIRHWCDAVDDRNPVYTDSVHAEQSVHGGIVAPPTMLMAWTMPGLRPPEDDGPAKGTLRDAMALLDAAGFTSVVATNCRQEYRRYLVPGDVLRPRETWSDPTAYDGQAARLARMCHENFERYGDEVSEDIRSAAPKR